MFHIGFMALILKLSSLRLQMYYWNYCGHSTDNYRINDKFNRRGRRIIQASVDFAVGKK